MKIVTNLASQTKFVDVPAGDVFVILGSDELYVKTSNNMALGFRDGKIREMNYLTLVRIARSLNVIF